MSTYFGLYYPYIHFRDEGWLRVIALYWDGLHRIVPQTAALRDSDDGKRLSDIGFINNAAPSIASAQIAGPFKELIATHREALSRKFGVAEAPMQRNHTLHSSDTRAEREALAFIWDEKFEWKLLDALLDAGLIVRGRGREPQWLGVHPALARVYMTALAEAMAPLLASSPTAEEGFTHVSISGLTMERLADALLGPEVKLAGGAPRASHEVEEFMASIALRYSVPKTPKLVPMEKIVALREETAEERGLFQDEVRKLIGSLPDMVRQVRDRDELERHLRAIYDKSIGPKLTRVDAALSKAGINTADAALATTFVAPAGVAQVFPHLGLGPGTTPLAVAGLAFGTWTLWRKHRSERDAALTPSAASYLYRVRQRLTPRGGVNEEITRARRSFLPYV